jgi:hypothetical protein
MNNPKKLATLGTQDTIRGQNKTTTQYSGGFKGGGALGASAPPSNKSSIYINIYCSRQLNDMTLNQMISICVMIMKVKQNTN